MSPAVDMLAIWASIRRDPFINFNIWFRVVPDSRTPEGWEVIFQVVMVELVSIERVQVVVVSLVACITRESWWTNSKSNPDFGVSLLTHFFSSTQPSRILRKERNQSVPLAKKLVVGPCSQHWQIVVSRRRRNQTGCCQRQGQVRSRHRCHQACKYRTISFLNSILFYDYKKCV